jgi:hypothetical protein
MPSTNPRNKIRWASATPAIAPSPSLPIRARSVVIMAICPSWVRAIGQASLAVWAISMRQLAILVDGAALAAMMVPGVLAAAPLYE